MTSTHVRPAEAQPPSYIEVKIDVFDYFLPYDDRHVMFSLGQYICINGAQFSSGEVVILMWKDGREVRGYYAGSRVFPKKGRLHYLLVMSDDEYRQWERQLTAYNRKILYGDRDAASMAKIRQEILAKLSDEKYDLKDFMEGFD